jgi:hypothetical protein
MLGLDQTAVVYTEHATTGLYSVVAKTGLKVRLAHIRGGETAGDRAELSATRNMLFEPDYVMPETAQVEVDGIRWQPKPGTFEALRDWNSNIVYRRADVVRQS